MTHRLWPWPVAPLAVGDSRPDRRIAPRSDR
jgi:hypothetical protein